MPHPPRIVFFGMPHTGKTALLHAFADPDAPLLLSQPLAPPPGRTRTMSNGVVLCDVDGRSAKEIIDDPRQLVRRNPTASDVRTADTIVLALDASATNEEMIELFRAFADFLDRLEASRSHDREVGGLPIYLTLTKCDTLHRPGDDPYEWLKRIDAKKQSLQTAFEDYLAESGRGLLANSPLSFGSIEVHVAATALQFPADERFKSFQSPFGVQDLQDTCIRSARAFRHRNEQSRRDLRWILTGSATLLGTMVATLLSLFLLSPTADEDLLAQRLRLYQQREGSAAMRLSDRQFTGNQQELQAIRNDSAYPLLPDDLRNFVENRLQEYEAYGRYRERFLPPQLTPATIRRRSELQELQTELDTKLAPPPEYATVWTETEAVRLWQKWKKDLELIRGVESTWYEWYRGLIRRGTALQLLPSIDYNWRLDVNTLLAESDRMLFNPEEPIEGSEKLPVQSGSPVTYRVPYEFDRVEQARLDWDDTRNRLVDMRDLAAALGMTAGPQSPPALLVLPEPTGDVNASIELAGKLLPMLPKADWFVSRFPDPIRREFQKRLAQARETAARHVQTILRAKMGPETRESWATAALWLQSPEARNWDQLLTRLSQWGEFLSVDPAENAVDFLQKNRFELDLSTLDLTLPNDLRDRRLRPDGPLVVRHKPQGGEAVEYRFREVGEGRRTESGTIHRFTPEGNPGRLTFRPGDELSAMLTVKGGDRSYRLEWTNSGSLVYQFDALNREPSIRLDVANAPAEKAVGVRLQAADLPRLPIVMRIQP